MAEQLDIDFLLERDRHAEALLDLSRRIERATTHQEAFDAALDVLRTNTPYRACWIYVFPKDAEYADFYLGTGPAQSASVARLSIKGDRMMEEIAAASDIVIVEDAPLDPRTDKKIVAELQCRTIINVPIIFDNCNLGALGTGTFGDEGVRLPGPAVRDFLKAIASHLAISLDRIRNRSQWQRAEKELWMWQVALDGMSDGAFMMENDRILSANLGACNSLGYRKDELVGKSIFEIDPVLTPERLQQLVANSNDGGRIVLESQHRSRDGRVFPVEVEISPFTYDDHHLAMVLTRDITERKRSDEALRRLNRTLLTLSSGNEALVRAGSEAELLDRMCRILVEVGGHRIVWIQLNHKPEDKELVPAAVASIDGSIPLAAERAPGGNALADALEGRKPELISDIYFDALSAACRADLLKAGCRAGLVLPLVAGSGLIGALSIFAENMDAFDKAELALLKELADDLAFGIQAQRIHSERQQAIARLQQTMEATIVALANTLELRDPYTAGHQRRVAILAKAIALRIGIDAERAEAIYLAGMIHDIGKIYVPSEVLTRPGRLTPLEFSLVQTHVEAGYGILHPIDFPWPLADIVHQHHERLDGSGYPRGIRGDDITLDARILAVADVVEAMSAHRPYRPGLGIDAALAEIESGKDKLYDTAVVDGCIALFRDDAFKFEQ
jgi:PAS domain S-box-containing protein/putative nucleotidyltransferase with HDIG domain